MNDPAGFTEHRQMTIDSDTLRTFNMSKVQFLAWSHYTSHKLHHKLITSPFKWNWYHLCILTKLYYQYTIYMLPVYVFVKAALYT